MSRILLLLGDSNVRRWHLNLGEPYLPVMDFVPSHNSEELSAALEQVRPSYQMVVFAGLTNIIVSAGSEATGGQIARLEAIQTAIKTTLTAISQAVSRVPDPSYYIAMPTIRTRPEWYLPLLPRIPPIILAILKRLRPGIRALPAFPMSAHDLDSDGIHLNALAGITYVQYLIDKPRALLEISASEGPSDGFNFLSDHMVTLSSTVASHDAQIKILKDQLLITRCQQAEEVCGRENTDNLNRFVIIGAPYLQLSDQLQAKLRSQVAYYIKLLNPRLPTDVVHVRQFRGKRGAIYDVEMSSVASSSKIRTAYGMFYRRGSQGPPPELSKISITNSLTYPSRVRVRIMKEIAKKHKIANPDLQVFVTNYLPRPTLKLKEKKGPMNTFNYSEAVQRFSHHLSQEFLINTTKYANVFVPREDLTNLFLVLSPDLLHGAGFTPSSPSEGVPPATSRQGPRASPSPGQSTTPATIAGKKRRVSLPSGNALPKFPKKGRPPKVTLVKTKSKGRPQPPPAPESMDLTSEQEGDEDEAPGVVSITPIDFSKEAED